MSCAYEYLQGCPSMMTFAFDAQNGVIDAVCDNRRKAYLESVACFTQNNLQRSIETKCILALTKIKAGDCGQIALVSECARETILMYDGCGSSDAELMKELIDVYLQPTAKLMNCSSPGEAVTNRPVNFDAKWSTKASTTPQTVSTRNNIPANEGTEKSIFQTTATNENADDKDLMLDKDTSYTAMSRLRESTYESSKEESESEEETPMLAAVRGGSKSSKSTGSSKTSSSKSKSSKKTSSSSKIKGTTSSTARGKTSSASNSKAATTVKPNSKQVTTGKSKAQGKTTEKSGKRKSGSDGSDKRDGDKSSSNTKQSSQVGSNDKNRAAVSRVSSVIWALMTSSVYVMYI